MCSHHNISFDLLSRISPYDFQWWLINKCPYKQKLILYTSSIPMLFSLDQYCAEVKGSSYIWIYLPNTILMYLLIFCSDWRHAVRNINTIVCLIGTGLGLDWDRRSGNFWFVRKRQTSTLICMPWSKDIDIICVYSSKSSMFISVKLSLLIEWLVFFSVKELLVATTSKVENLSLSPKVSSCVTHLCFMNIVHFNYKSNYQVNLNSDIIREKGGPQIVS